MTDTIQPDSRQPLATVEPRVERIPGHVWVHCEDGQLIGRLEAKGRLAAQLATDQRLTLIVVGEKLPQFVEDGPRLPGR